MMIVTRTVSGPRCVVYKSDARSSRRPGDSFTSSVGSMKLVAPGRHGVPPVIPPCEMVTVTVVVAGTCELARYFGHHSMVFGTWLSVYGGVRVQLTYEDHSAKLSSMGAPAITRQLYSHMMRSHRQLSVDSEWKVSLSGLPENEREVFARTQVWPKLKAVLTASSDASIRAIAASPSTVTHDVGGVVASLLKLAVSPDDEEYNSRVVAYNGCEYVNGSDFGVCQTSSWATRRPAVMWASFPLLWMFTARCSRLPGI